MSYTTPHDAREYLKAAALRICHDYKLRCLGLGTSRTKTLLERTREIDLCARLADFFGPSAHLAAQGTDDIDLLVYGPTIKAEVKYLIGHKNSWANVKEDWDWLAQDATNAGNEFSKWAWLVFWPTIEQYRFTACQTVTRDHGTQYSSEGYAPFVTYVEPRMPPTGANQQLHFQATPPRVGYISMHGGKTVRVDIIGDTKHPLWCALYTRCLSTAVPAGATRVAINNTPITLP